MSKDCFGGRDLSSTTYVGATEIQIEFIISKVCFVMTDTNDGSF